MNSFPSFYSLVVGVINIFIVESWSDVQVTGITNSNGLVETEFKVNRVNKTTYVINGSVKITEDFSNAYDVGMMAYYSSIGNNQYTLLPYKFARTPLCSFWDGLYRRAFSKHIEECSTFPKQVDGQPLCPLFVKV